MRPHGYALHGVAVLVAALLAGCAQGVTLTDGLAPGAVTGSLNPQMAAPAATIATAAPKAAAKGAKGAKIASAAPAVAAVAAPPPEQAVVPPPAPSGAEALLAALNPLPALAALAAAAGTVEPTPPSAASAPVAIVPEGPRSAIGRQADERVVAGEPTAIYSRVARGALTCWLGGKGPLKGTHMFQAEAQPQAKGGEAEIGIHEIDKTQQFPRGLNAFRISVSNAVSGMSRVEAASIRVPQDLAEAMRADVLAWAEGRHEHCQAQVVRPPKPDPAPLLSTAKPKRPVKRAG